MLLCGTIYTVFAQNSQGLKIKVEKLSKPQEVLYSNSYDDICKSLILSESGLSKYELRDDSTGFPFNIRFEVY